MRRLRCVWDLDPPGVANRSAHRLRNFSKPCRLVPMSTRLGVSPMFLKVWTEFFGMNTTPPRSTSCQAPSRKKDIFALLNKENFVFIREGGPPTGGVVSVQRLSFPPVCAPPRSTISSSWNASNLSPCSGKMMTSAALSLMSREITMLGIPRELRSQGGH